MSDILDNILKGIPKPETTPAAPAAPAVHTDEQPAEKKTSMSYSPDFEAAYGKKS